MLEAFWLCMANNDMLMNASPTVIQLRITVNLRHYITGIVAQRSIVLIDDIAQLAVQRLNELEPGASCGSIPFPSIPMASMAHSHMTVCCFTGPFMFTPRSKQQSTDPHSTGSCGISLNSTSNSIFSGQSPFYPHPFLSIIVVFDPYQIIKKLEVFLR